MKYLAKIIPGSQKDHDKQYPYQALNKFWHHLARSWMIFNGQDA